MFSAKSKKYFSVTSKHLHDKEVFLKNKKLYEDNVKAPMTLLLDKIKEEFQNEIDSSIPLDAINISRPLYPSNKAESKGWIKSVAHFKISEKKTSLYEDNPCIYFQIGKNKERNLLGIGLYMPSSRQMKRLREAFVEDFNYIDHILSSQSFSNTWHEFKGERFKVFPRNCNKDDFMNPYLWQKQYFVSKHYSWKELQNKSFINQLNQDIRSGLQFFTWLRNVVGVSPRNKIERF